MAYGIFLHVLPQFPQAALLPLGQSDLSVVIGRDS